MKGLLKYKSKLKIPKFRACYSEILLKMRVKGLLKFHKRLF